VNNKPTNELLESQTNVIGVLQAVSMTALWSYLGTTWLWEVDDGIDWGLFWFKNEI